MLLRAAVLSAEWQMTSVHSRNAEMVCAAELLTRRPQAFFLFFLSETLRRDFLSDTPARMHASADGELLGQGLWFGVKDWLWCGVDDQIVIMHATVLIALLPPFRRRRGT